MLYFVPKKLPAIMFLVLEKGPCISCLLLHNSKCNRLKQQTLSHYEMFLWVKNFREAHWVVLAEGLSSCCSQDVGQGYSHLKAWLGLVGSLPKQLIYMIVDRRPWFFTGVCRRPQFFSHGPLHRAASMSSQHVRSLLSEREVRERARRRPLCPNLYLLHNMFFTSQ